MTTGNSNDANMLAFDELLKERRRDRFWRNVRFAFIIGIAITAMVIQAPLFSAFGSGSEKEFEEKPYVTMVTLNGAISENNPRASDYGLRELLTDAFEDENSEGVVLKISSPGGTPVQSNLIRERIERLKEKTGKRVIAVGEEAMASGAYLVAMAADTIYAQPASIVGSIGVRMTTFGASELIDKVGVERRIYTAGEKKVELDPFQPESEEAVEHARTILNDIHDQFIGVVKASRGERIDFDNSDLFSGQYWTGRQAVDLGLIDGVANVSDAIDEEFGTRRVRSYGPPNNILTRMGLLVQSAAEIFSSAGTTQIESVWGY
jgi:protease-4